MLRVQSSVARLQCLAALRFVEQRPAAFLWLRLYTARGLHTYALMGNCECMRARARARGVRLRGGQYVYVYVYLYVCVYACECFYVYE